MKVCVSLVRVREKLEVVLLVFVNCVIISLFSLPIIFYFIPQNQMSTFNTTNCSNQIQLVHIRDCVSKPYIGELCMETLRTAQTCTFGPRNIVSVNSSLQQQSMNTSITTFLNTLEHNINSSLQCRDLLLLFMCHYLFPLCDNVTGQLYQPRQSECIRISEQVCPYEWNQSRQLDLLPDCAALNDAEPQNVSCDSDFIKINQSCHPLCERFELQSRTTTILTRIIKLISAIFGIAGGCAFLVASAVQYKQMFSFPLILLVYMTVELLVFAIVFLVTEVGSPGLLCGSATIEQTRQNPTLLCTISGAVFHYVVVGVQLFWFFHICFFFYKVMFPFHSNAHKSKGKYLHLIMAIIGFVVPVPAVVVALTVNRYKYRIAMFPPTICFSPDHFFYSGVLVIMTLTILSTVLLTIILWKVRKHNTLLKTHQGAGQASLISTAEKKLLAVFTVYILSGLITVVTVSFFRLIGRNQLMSALSNYLACEYNGHVPGKCTKQLFDSISWLVSVAYLLLGLLPSLNLLFVVNFGTVESKMKSIVRRSFKLDRSNDGPKQQSTANLILEVKPQTNNEAEVNLS